ncbi:cytochrome P450 [Janthinobacterium fluminis]|uniref:Cytochrome P450 n=1 Tax=Janthinobacterium fluminis TaxID=2987524 RepID=A0ABT5K6M5_9BURK|nr:cytochrome P450 [Janthinobacterium fluminis]MDC8760655.1 cytochrome P450 [Janthinobacterium fluminis]
MTFSSSTALNAPAGSPALRSIASLPGPFALPLVGSALQIRPTRVHLDVERWARRYGPLFRLRLGRNTMLVVAGHEHVSAVLRERPDGFRRPSVTADVALEIGGITGLFLAEGADWRNQRRMVMQGFAPAAIRAYFPALVTVALRLQRRWEAAAAGGRSIDLSEDLKRYTVDIIAGLAFGTEVNTIDSGEDVIQRHLDVMLPAVARRSLALFPYWRYVRLPADRRLERSAAGLTAAVADLVGQARRRMQAEPARRARPANLLEAMLAAADQEGSGVDDDTVGGNVATMLLAGEDTTANTIAWMLYLLHCHPQALRKAQDEVRRVAPDPAAFCVEQMDALEYLGACASEAMRLKPVAPYLPLEALRDSVVGDVAVPAGTTLWCVMRKDSVADTHVQDGAAFDPQRWLRKDEVGPPDKHLSLPFGAGPRTCPGRYLALLEMKIVVAMLLARFELAGVDTPDGREARELMGFVMSPVGLRMRLRQAGGAV